MKATEGEQRKYQASGGSLPIGGGFNVPGSVGRRIWPENFEINTEEYARQTAEARQKVQSIFDRLHALGVQ